MKNLIQVAISRATRETGIALDVTLYDQCIDSEQPAPPYTAIDCCIIVLFTSTFLAVAISTISVSSDEDKKGSYQQKMFIPHCYIRVITITILIPGSKSVGLKVLEAFSLRKNWKKFVFINESSGELPYLDGLRVISTLNIVLIHVLYFSSQADFNNKKSMMKVITNRKKACEENLTQQFSAYSFSTDSRQLSVVPSLESIHSCQYLLHNKQSVELPKRDT